MSNLQQQDGFSNTLAEVERLTEVWAELSATQAKGVGVAYLVIQRVEALMSPQMFTPYSMSVEALERLSSLRKRGTDLNLRDECFTGVLEALAVTMIKERAASQPVTQKDSMLVDDVPWEYRNIEALEDWLTIRRNLLTSFGEEGAVIEQLNDVIEDKALDFLEEWDPDEAGMLIKRLELCAKLKAIPELDDPWIDEDIEDTIDELRGSESQANTSVYVSPQFSEQPMPGRWGTEYIESIPTQGKSADSRRRLHGKIKQLEATVFCLEQRVNSLGIADKELESSTKTLDKTKELLAEAEEDRTAAAKANNQLITENERLQDSLAAALREKDAMAGNIEDLHAEIANLTASAEQKQDQIEWLNQECDRLSEMLESANTRERTLTEEKEALVSANASLESPLSIAKDEHAALAKSNEKLRADVSRKVDELGCALEIMSDLKDQRERCWHQSQEEKAALEEELADTKESLHRATSTITADNMHRLTAQNFQLEEQLKGANDIIGQINSTLRSCSSSTSTVCQPSTIRRSPDTATDNLIEPNEDHGLRNGFPVDPYVMGEAESDVSSTILTPGSSVDLDEAWDLSVNDL